MLSKKLWLITLFILGTVFLGCDNGTTNEGNYSIVGLWKMATDTSIYSLNFTNYGIITCKHGYSSPLAATYTLTTNYTYSGKVLSLSGSGSYSGGNGTATFSNNGNTLTVSGFIGDPDSIHYEGGVYSPIKNGIYMRQ
jgi:hypothetical protein